MAGREALRYFEDEALMSEVKRKGQRMAECVESLASANADKGYAARGAGMIQALDVADGARGKEIAKRCFEAGLLVGPCGTGGKVIKLIPPLTIPDEDLDAGLKTLETIVREVA